MSANTELAEKLRKLAEQYHTPYEYCLDDEEAPASQFPAAREYIISEMIAACNQSAAARLEELSMDIKWPVMSRWHQNRQSSDNIPQVVKERARNSGIAKSKIAFREALTRLGAKLREETL